MYSPRIADVTKRACCPECGRALALEENEGLSISVKSVTVDGTEYKLGSKNCELLRILARTPGETVHREIIYSNLWGGDSDVFDKTIDVMVCKINRVLRGTRASVKCERGVGYRLMLSSRVEN